MVAAVSRIDLASLDLDLLHDSSRWPEPRDLDTEPWIFVVARPTNYKERGGCPDCCRGFVAEPIYI
jgi:hypothetical protein